MCSPSSDAAGVPASLGPGRPVFQAWKLSEMPSEWQATLMNPETQYVGVELPDMPWGHVYNNWFTANCTAADRDTWAAVVVVNMVDYHGGEGQKQQAAEVLKYLLETGKPPPDFVRILKTELPVSRGLTAVSQTSDTHINQHLKTELGRN